MKRTILQLFFFFLPILVSYITAAEDQFKLNKREKYNFNSEWLMFIGDDIKASSVKYNDSSWARVTLPRAFNEDEIGRAHV